MAAASKSDTRTLMVLSAIFLLIMPWTGLWYSDRSSAAVAYSATNMVLLPFVCLIVAAVEQLVVALTARALGDRLIVAQFGLGPTLFRRTIKSVYIVVNAVPCFSGSCIVSARVRGQRLRIGLSMLAGTLTIVAIFALSVGGDSWSVLKQRFATEPAISTLFVVACVTSGCMSALNAFGALIGTRGFTNINAINLQTRRALYFVETGAYDQAVSAARGALAVAPDDFLLQFLLASALSARADTEAFAAAEALIKKADLPEHLLPACLNLWAWQCCMRGDSRLAGEADHASLEALSRAKANVAPFLDTRGHVLLWLGRVSEAEEHLQRAYNVTSHRSTRTTAAAGMAMLCANHNRPDDAAMWLARARQHDPNNPMLPRAIAVVEPLNRT